MAEDAGNGGQAIIRASVVPGRGKCRLAHGLRPKLYRTKHDLVEVLRQEQDLRLEFKRRGSQLVGEGKPSDHWERYFLMEHYGVPTRLLDLSDGALPLRCTSPCGLRKKRPRRRRLHARSVVAEQARVQGTADCEGGAFQRLGHAGLG